MARWHGSVLFLTLTFALTLACKSTANSPVTEVRTGNLKELLDARNGRVAAAKLDFEAAQLRTDSLRRSFLPSLELHGAQESFASGTQARKSQPTFGAEVKVNVFNGGRDRIKSEVRDLTVEKKSLEHKRVEAEELEKVRLLLWQILYVQEKETLLKATLAVNAQNLTAAQRRIRSGIATDSDRFEFEMNEVELKREMEALRLQLEREKAALSLLLGLEGQVGSLKFPEKLNHEHDFEETLAHSARDHAFLYRQSEILATQLRLSAKESARDWWPKVDLFAAYTQHNEREKDHPSAIDRTESIVGARVSIQLASGLDGQREAAAILQESKAADLIAAYSKREVEVHIKGELAQLKFLHGQIHEADENIKRAERYYKLTQSEYVRGVKNSPDVLGASEKLFDMQHKRLEITRDFQFAKAHVLAKLGK